MGGEVYSEAVGTEPWYESFAFDFPMISCVK